MTYFKQVEIASSVGDLVGVTSYGEVRVVEPIRLAGAAFTGDKIDPNFWATPTVLAGGAVTQANGQQTLVTGAAANGSARSVSIALARYVTGSQMRYLARTQMGDSGMDKNARRWGAFSGTNGAYFKLAGTTLYACTMINSAETGVASDAWNQNKEVPTLTNTNFYEIYYTPESVIFVINGTVAHLAVFPISPWTAAYHLPVYMDNTNSGGLGSNLWMSLRECAITRLGRFETQPKYFHGNTALTSVLKYGPGMLHRVTINTSASRTVKLYDNTADSGPLIAIISATPLTGPLTVSYGVPFTTGLTVVSSGNWDFTVIYE